MVLHVGGWGQVWSLCQTISRVQRLPQSRIMWIVVKVMGPFWLQVVLRHLIFRATKLGTLLLGTAHVLSKPWTLCIPKPPTSMNPTPPNVFGLRNLSPSADPQHWPTP